MIKACHGESYSNLVVQLLIRFVGFTDSQIYSPRDFVLLYNLDQCSYKSFFRPRPIVLQKRYKFSMARLFVASVIVLLVLLSFDAVPNAQNWIPPSKQEGLARNHKSPARLIGSIEYFKLAPTVLGIKAPMTSKKNLQASTPSLFA